MSKSYNFWKNINNIVTENFKKIMFYTIITEDQTTIVTIFLDLSP